MNSPIFTSPATKAGPQRKRSTPLSHTGGLTEAEVISSRKQFGSNRLTKKKQPGFFRQFLSNLNDPIVKILIVAMVINTAFSFSDSGWAESIGIAITVLISTLVTTLSEHSSGAAFDKLYASLADVRCTVIRDSKKQECSVNDLVKFDLVHLYPGDTVPADGILIKGKLFCDQSSLTGESKPAAKVASKAVDWERATVRSGDTASLFRGSHVTEGSGVMLVLAVGDSTVYGAIAAELAAEESASPLKNRLTRLAGTISKIGYVSAAVVALVHLADAFWFDAGMNPAIAFERIRDLHFLVPQLIRALTLAISIVVVAVPEGLPMMITVVLSSNMKRMLKAGVLVRRLVGIETAGSMDILFTDKTGTLTTGELSVTAFATVDTLYASAKECPPTLREELRAAAEACSSVQNATEIAVNRFLCISPRPDAAKEDHIPFDSARKFAAGCHGPCFYVRGAAEYLLPACDRYRSRDGSLLPLTRDVRDHILATLSRYASDSCRVLLCAQGDREQFPRLRDGKPDPSFHLIFSGLYIIRDEIRDRAVSAVESCRSAGIQVVMLTGDNVQTAAAIAARCGILQNKKDEIVLDGDRLRALTDEEILQILPQIRVIARVTPTDKSRLVKIAKSSGHITGMTGDGVNDAPALKAADVGFAMGSGTDIAREAGDIVITDDNFVSISKAVLYGRTIFQGIRKFITFQLTMNLAAVGVSVLGTCFGIDHPVTVIQMLWVNMIMDTLGSLAFAGEPPLTDYMRQPPVSLREHILTPAMVRQILLTGAYGVGLSMFFLLSPRIRWLFGGSESVHLTQFFALFIFMGIGIALCTRTERIRLFAGIRKNKAFLVIMPAVAAIQLIIVYFGGKIFRCVPLSGRELLLCAVFAATVIPADTIRKATDAIIRERRKAAAAKSASAKEKGCV